MSHLQVSWLTVCHVVEGYVDTVVLLVDYHGVTMTECRPSNILTTDANIVTCQQSIYMEVCAVTVFKYPPARQSKTV